MADTTKDISTTAQTTSSESGSSHHSSSHHHSGSHYHRHHHSSSHHHRHHHSHSYRSSSSSKSGDSSSETTNKNFTLAGFLKKKSHSRSHRPIPTHRSITYRIMFALAITSFAFYAISGILEPEDQSINKLANNTRSESAQLKAQIAIQQMELDALKNKLQRYEDLYGVLDDPDGETIEDTNVTTEETSEETEE